MDAIDRQLLTLLRANGRLSHEQLARQVHLSRPAVHERLKRLEAQGAIRGYTAIVAWEALDQPLLAFVWVRTAGAKCRDMGAQLLVLNDERATIEACYRVTGEWCMLLHTRAQTAGALERLIDRIRDTPGVVATMTTLALSVLDGFSALAPDEQQRDGP